MASKTFVGPKEMEKPFLEISKGTLVLHDYKDFEKRYLSGKIKEGDCIAVFYRMPGGDPLPILYVSGVKELYLGSPSGPAQDPESVLNGHYWIICRLTSVGYGTSHI